MSICNADFFLFLIELRERTVGRKGLLVTDSPLCNPGSWHGTLSQCEREDEDT